MCTWRDASPLRAGHELLHSSFQSTHLRLTRARGSDPNSREVFMARNSLYASVATIALVALLGGVPAPASAQQAAQAVAIDADDIGGVVTGPKGPEAGVWVIAETTD